MTDILLPAVSPTMERATLSRWLVAPGAAVRRGEPIAELETDKASVEIAAESDGVVSELVIAAGTPDVPVGAVIARLNVGAIHSRPPPRTSGTPGGPFDTGPPAPIPMATPLPELGPPRAPPEPSVPTPRAETESLASPLARRLARQLGIALHTVRGSDPHGRITRADLERVDARLRVPPSPVAPVTPRADVAFPAPYGVPHAVVPMSAMRKTIARRLGDYKRTAPHFYMTVDIAMDALLDLREQCNLRPRASKLSLNDFVIRALAMALHAAPAANVQYAGDSLLRFSRVDISVAVAVPDGLYMPVIRDAANKSVQTIAGEMRALVQRAKAGRLLPSDFEGGTFSLSNLGMYGIKQFEAVINPPQAGILAVGETERRVVPADDDNVRVARQLSATLSCDHRVIDGAVGAALLQDIKQRMQDPLGLLLD